MDQLRLVTEEKWGERRSDQSQNRCSGESRNVDRLSWQNDSPVSTKVKPIMMGRYRKGLIDRRASHRRHKKCEEVMIKDDNGTREEVVEKAKSIGEFGEVNFLYDSSDDETLQFGLPMDGILLALSPSVVVKNLTDQNDSPSGKNDQSNENVPNCHSHVEPIFPSEVSSSPDKPKF